MPAHLQQQLQELRDQLAQQPPLSDDDKAALAALLEEIDQQLTRSSINPPDTSLVDGVNLAVERFEVEHPTVAGTLRNILQSLANMGI
ncbi:MAG: chromosome partitioning protein ParA [Pseudomonas sp. PGPPP3]|jgi:hypothetical protein|nr:MAG: chromosome partitioning protein ParA [Pseudomonas sp. PGPPP3]